MGLLTCAIVVILVANDERTNGVKILRKKDPPVDLNTELNSITNRAVIARLKLILQKLENGQLEAISPEVLSRNILYAVTLIQGGDPALDRSGRLISLFPPGPLSYKRKLEFRLVGGCKDTL